MVLVDTSVWVQHLRRTLPVLARLLAEGVVAGHPFVVGELACGNLRNRAEILCLLSNLPSAAVAGHEDVLQLIEVRRLMGTGLGWIDVHLLASALLSGFRVWTLDRRLRTAAADLGVGFST